MKSKPNQQSDLRAQHRTFLIIFFINLQANIIAPISQMLSSGGDG